MATTDNFDVTAGVYSEGRNDLFERLLDGWRDMRGSTRRLLAECPSEARLLFYVLMSDMIFFTSWSVKAIVKPTAGAAEHLPSEIAFWLVIAMLFRTSAMYFLSIVVGSAARIAGGTGDWRSTRTAVFWGALVAAPAGLACAILSAVLASAETALPVLGAQWITLLPYWISLAPFFWFISAGIAEAHGFKRANLLFVVMVAATTALALLFMHVQG